MNPMEFAAEARRTANRLSAYSIDSAEGHWNVFKDKPTGKAFPCATRNYRVTGTNDAGKSVYHLVVISFHRHPETLEPQVHAWCGDAYAEGRGGSSRRGTPQNDALEFARSFWPMAQIAVLQRLLDAGFGAFTKSDGCNFWRLHASGSGPCKHVRHVYAERGALLDDDLGELQNAWDQMMMGATASATVPQLGLGEDCFGIPTLLIGPPATGKTHAARTLADAASVSYVEYGCQSNTEPVELLGCTAPFGGKWVWKDGPVSEAFRRAQRGEKVVLCLDELLRMERHHLSVLLTALSEHNGTYRLRTGRILAEQDGVGTEETLIAPAGNLAVVATTNVGASFGIDAIDPAIRSRFEMVFMGDAEAAIKAGLADMTAEKGWSQKSGDALLKLHQMTAQGARQNLLAAALDMRAMQRALKRANSEDALRASIGREWMQCVALDAEGAPIQEQRQYFEKMLAKAFS